MVSCTVSETGGLTPSETVRVAQAVPAAAQRTLVAWPVVAARKLQRTALSAFKVHE
jgi:hypothetical protein